MNNIYHTQEGQTYKLRQVTKTVTDFVVAADTPLILLALVSTEPDPALDIWQYIQVNTSRPIIPLMYNFAAIDVTAGPFESVLVSDLASPYYGFTLNGAANFKHLTTIAKMYPLIEMMDFDDILNYHYGLKYDQAQVSYDDFLTIAGFTAFPFFPSQGWSMLNKGLSDTVYPDIVIPAGTYSFAITFTYFELIG